MDPAELLPAKGREYELLAISLGDAASLSDDNGRSAAGFVVIAIALREVADALEEAA